MKKGKKLNTWWMWPIFALATFLLFTGIDPVAELGNFSENTKSLFIFIAVIIAIVFIFFKKNNRKNNRHRQAFLKEKLFLFNNI